MAVPPGTSARPFREIGFLNPQVIWNLFVRTKMLFRDRLELAQVSASFDRGANAPLTRFRTAYLFKGSGGDVKRVLYPKIRKTEFRSLNVTSSHLSPGEQLGDQRDGGESG